MLVAMSVTTPVQAQDPTEPTMPPALETFFRFVDGTDAAIRDYSEAVDTSPVAGIAEKAIEWLLATPPEPCLARAHGRYLLFLESMRLIHGIVGASEELPDTLHARYHEHLAAFRTDRRDALNWCLGISPMPTAPPPPSLTA
jgi:hypothetical protein